MSKITSYGNTPSWSDVNNTKSDYEIRQEQIQEAEKVSQEESRIQSETVRPVHQPSAFDVSVGDNGIINNNN